MKRILTDEQFVALLNVLEEGEKSFTQASYRDLMMTAHTDMFFELGVRDVATMDAGWKAFKGLQNNFQGKLASVYGKFQAGTMTTAGATTEFQTLLRKYSKDAFMAGTQMVGNKYYTDVGMTKKDLAFVNKYVRAETRHFRKFLNDIKDPKHLPASRIPRDKLGRIKPGYRQRVHPYAKRMGYYADSLRSMGYNGMVAGAGTLLNIYWVMDKLSGRRSPHCEDCIMIAAGNPYSWQTLPTTPRAGDTQCLFRCYCGLEFQQAGKGKEFDIPGSGSTQGLTAPGRWARVFDRAGRQITGTSQQDVEDIYQRMFKARQMIDITRGAEKLEWIRIRRRLNDTLIQQSPHLRKVPSVAVKDLTKAVLKAQPKQGNLLNSFVGVNSGDQVTFVRGNYISHGKLILKNNKFIFKDASGVELIANLETDVIWQLQPKWRPSATLESANKWAKGSVIKDVVYHGTTIEAAGKIMDKGFLYKTVGSHTGNRGLYGKGFYFSSSESYASQYAKGKGGGGSLKLRLNVKNPLKGLAKFKEFQELARKDIAARGLSYQLDEYIDTITRLIKKAGYDAVWIDRGPAWGGDEICVFNSKNIIIIKD